MVDAETSAEIADSEYGSRADAAFNALGTAPLEVLNEDEEMDISDITEALTEDDNVSGVNRRFVKKYFDVLEEMDIIDYKGDTIPKEPWDETVSKNGKPDEYLETFIQTYQEL